MKGHCLDANLISEWHLSKNTNLAPHDVTHGSHKVVWWRCSLNHDHEWQAVIYSRSQVINMHTIARQMVSNEACFVYAHPDTNLVWMEDDLIERTRLMICS